jgi:small subunit ribosomal protein S4e
MIKRKEATWVTSTIPGPHDKNALPINVLLRDVMSIAANSSDVKKLLNESKILVDGKARKDHKFPVGLMDIISIPAIKKHFRLVYDHIGRLKAIPSNDKESVLKIVRIKNKFRKDKDYQLSTNDGRNLTVKLTVGKGYKTGDSLLIKVPSQEIIKHLPFNKGVVAYVIGGKHVSKKVMIKGLTDNIVTFDFNGEEHRTSKNYLLVIGDKKEELKINE